MKEEFQKVFSEDVINDFNEILLSCAFYTIADIMLVLQDNKEYLDLIVFTLNKYYKDDVSEVIERLNQENNSKSRKVLRAIKKFPSDKESLAKIEQNYFKYLFKIIKKEKYIGAEALVYALQVFKNDKHNQTQLLNCININNIERGIEYALETEEYEIAILLTSFKGKLPPVKQKWYEYYNFDNNKKDLVSGVKFWLVTDYRFTSRKEKKELLKLRQKRLNSVSDYKKYEYRFIEMYYNVMQKKHKKIISGDNNIDADTIYDCILFFSNYPNIIDNYNAYIEGVKVEQCIAELNNRYPKYLQDKMNEIIEKEDYEFAGFLHSVINNNSK